MVGKPWDFSGFMGFDDGFPWDLMRFTQPGKATNKKRWTITLFFSGKTYYFNWAMFKFANCYIIITRVDVETPWFYIGDDGILHDRKPQNEVWLSVVVNGGSDKRSVWGNHIPNIYDLFNGELFVATNRGSQPSISYPLVNIEKDIEHG